MPCAAQDNYLRMEEGNDVDYGEDHIQKEANIEGNFRLESDSECRQQQNGSKEGGEDGSKCSFYH